MRSRILSYPALFVRKSWAFFRKSRRHTALASVCMVMLVGLAFTVIKHVSADAGWTQTDWSGGVGASTTDQYSSSSNVDTSTSGQMSLNKTSGWGSNFSSWKYRKKITFDNTDATLGVTSEALTDFPVLVKLTSSNFDFSKAQSAGQDIRFADSDGNTALSYEIESWDSGNQTAYVWVKVPQIDQNSDTDSIYAYYGNGSANDGQDKTSVWDDGYQAVWHMNDATSSTIADSTSNDYTGTKGSTSSTAPTSVTGQIGSAQHFYGNSYIDFGNILSPGTSDWTIEVWFDPTATGSANGSILYNKENTYEASGGGGVTTYAWTPHWAWDGGSSAPISTDNWYDYVVTYDHSNQTMYQNGAQVYQRAQTGNMLSNTSHLQLGARGNTGHSSFFTGNIDEVRISNVSRSAAWLAATHESESGQMNSYGSEQSEYSSSGTLTSAIFDGALPNDWGDLTYNATAPAGTSVSVKVRSGNQSDLSDASSWSSCSAVSSGNDVTSACAADKSRYVQYQVTLSTTDSAATPVFQDNTIGYSASDTVAPITNASSILAYKSDGGDSVSSNGWVNSDPYFAWTAGADDVGGSGIKGYCLYLGQDDTADPVSTKGLLGDSPVNTNGSCQFAVSGTNVDLSTSGYIGTALSTSSSPYYLVVKAIDNADNVYSGSAATFQFRYDNTPPTNPSFITAPSQFVSSKDVTLTWPTSGGDAPSDTNSGLAGLQYRIGSSGIWYGDNHNSAQDATDLLSDDGSYTTQSSPDYASLQEGNNIVYFRTWDNAGNISTAYVTTVIKLNTSSPSAPQNVTASPDTNTTNSFAFSWLAPASFTGSVSNMTYCYTVNTLPSSSSCTYTSGGTTSLSAGAYATQPGENTFYVVAKDEAGNINYATAASTTFTANTAAPGVPLNTDIADISVKSTSNWKLALSWEEPSQTGAGIASYKVLRSTDGSTYSQVASTSGTSYVDSGLSQHTYYYKVKACDSANNCGALTGAVSKYPTGKFTSPAALISKPKVSNLSTKKATIAWVTDRTSDSKVAYGTKPGTYGSDEIANSDQTTGHTINLVNLDPGTTYYFISKWTDEDGNTGTSAQGSFATLPAPNISSVKTSGVNVSSATITFTSTGASSVKLYYGKSKDFGGTKVLNTSTSESTYSTQLTGLDDGTDYYFKIDPFDADGNEYSQTIFTFATPPRPRITNLRFQPVKDQPTSTQQITWDTNVPATSELAYGPDGQAQKNSVDTRLTAHHKVLINGLADNTLYSLVAQSRDSAGNLATSDKQVFHTALDTRPPKISDLKVKASIKGTGTDAAGQIIVSWKTDEPATSQVAYGEGSKNSDYNTSTAEDRALVTDHAVVVSNLSTSQIFHLRALSKDKAGNLAHSDNRTTIIGNATDSVISIIFNALQKIFGGFGG